MSLSLGRSLRRQLALRLGIGGAVIAAALGGAVLWHEIEGIEEALVEEAVRQAGSLSSRLPARLNADTAPQVQAALEQFLTEHQGRRLDHFVGAEIYGPDRVALAEALGPDAGEAEATIDRSVHVFPKDGGSRYAAHRSGGRFYLQVVTSLADGAGRPQAGYFEGIYHVTPERMAAVRHAGLRTAFMVILAVLATSGLLYPIILQLHRNLAAGARALLAANVGAIEMLGNAIAKRDSDTNSHNYRVTIYALRLAEAVGLPSSTIRSLVKGAFLHDLGKLAIPDSILLKPGKLDEAEFTVMKTHVSHGLDIVRRFQWLSDAADVVGCHHEKFDGSGYTAGLAGEDIPMTARIFAIADVFDALTSRRPYKEPRPVAETLEIMARERARHFDPALLDAFIPLAPALYAEFGEREDIGLDDALRRLALGYFADTLEA